MNNKEESKPNIVYILADDMGYGDVSFFNRDCPIKTPNIDTMCASGISFTDAHASSAVCTPSRYSILTGRYNWRSRLKKSVLGGYSETLIEDERQTVADLLKNVGYQTAAIGKWHLGMNFKKKVDFEEAANFSSSEGIDYLGRIEKSPISKGFDYFYGISGSLDMPPYVYIENDRFTEVPSKFTKGPGGKQFWREGLTGENFMHENVLDELTTKVCDKIEEYNKNPFFIYFPMPAPHTPILPSKQFVGKSGTNAYGDFVLQCDDVVGRIIKTLKQQNVYENTIVIFTSDNGCSPMADFKELSAFGHNPSYIFRGAKADIYEGGHRVPLVVQWPKKIISNKVSPATVCLSDFMATIADVLNITLTDNEAEDSISNKTIWQGATKTAVREFVVHQSIDGSLSIRNQQYKLLMCEGSGGWSAPIPGVPNSKKTRFQLFDLSADIGEKIISSKKMKKLQSNY